MMQAGNLAESALLEFLCRPPHVADREAALHAAATACLSVPGAGRAWAKLQSQTVEAAGSKSVSRYPYGLEVPVDLAGQTCGTVGLEAAQPVNGSAHEHAAAVAELLATWEARRYLGDAGEKQTIVGCSPEIRHVEMLARRYAGIDEPVLIQGETGVGKELIAQMLHCVSGRKDVPMSTINCAAVPDELIASELFGHRRGAFTGAVRDQRGRFEIADGGTLFLDEIGEMGPGLQAALLRVLEYGEMQQVGDEGRMRRIDVRIVAATNRDLAADVAEGRFRSDLYYRLTPLTIDVPPLRHRPDDIPVLARYFVRVLEERWGQSLELVTEALGSMLSYSFPGNVRELRNLVLRAAATSCSGRIESIPLPRLMHAEHDQVRASRLTLLPPPAAAVGAEGRGSSFRSGPNGYSDSDGHVSGSGSFRGDGRSRGNGRGAASNGSSSGRNPEAHPAADLAILPAGRATGRSFPHAGGNGHSSRETMSLDTATAAHLRKVLSIAKGNVSQAARMLDIPRTTLQSKLRRYGVQ
jgi:transcriptional regulator with GAF, ATPase, and Fis domain